MLVERMQFLVDGNQVGTIQADEQGRGPSSAPFDQEVLHIF